VVLAEVNFQAMFEAQQQQQPAAGTNGSNTSLN
jgi:preprotein translocase subunit SecB